MLRLFLVSLLSAQTFSYCPKESVDGSIDGACYFGVASAFAFAKGEDFCVNFDGHLASITNEADNEKVLNIGGQIVEEEKTIWLGGTYDGKNVSWFDGSLDIYQNFIAGTPPGNMMMNLTNGKWLTANFNVKLPLVCVSKDQISTAEPTCESPCPTEWFYVAELQSCYKQIFGVTFSNADATCRSMDAMIVSIHSAEENRVVDQLLHTQKTMNNGATDCVLLGAVKNGPGKTDYAWYDGTPWNYTNWREEGVLNSGSCLIIFPDLWDAPSLPPLYYLHRWDVYPCETTFRATLCKKRAKY